MSTVDPTAIADAQVRSLPQMTTRGLGYWLFAETLVSLGLLGIFTGQLAGPWQRPPIELPLPLLAYAFAAIELTTGLGLMFRATAAPASWVLASFVLLWAAFFKLPGVLASPQTEARWMELGEITMMAAAAWIILIRSTDGTHLPALTGVGGLRSARWLFALSLLPEGLFHFFYLKPATGVVPAWLPWREGWVLLTGAISVATVLALLLKFQTRLAATLQTAMFALITLVVWTPLLTPPIPGLPADLQFKVTGFVMSTTITAAVWVVADSYARRQRSDPASA